MKSKQQLMHDIQVYDFAVQEASLFLNSHPYDSEAMRYYQENRKKKEDATALYETYYGALSNRRNVSDRWEYVYGPWPWEGDNEVCGHMKNDYNFR